MATVLILHSALGLRPAVLGLEEQVRALGHHALAPDLFEGAVFDGGEQGYAAAMAHLQANRAAAQARVDEVFAALDGPVVVIGFSMGALWAQHLAEAHPQVVGALLVAGGGRYGAEFDDHGVWPAKTPLALHHMIDDAWVDAEPLAALIAQAARGGSDVSDYVYPGSAHLFTDDGLPDEFDAAASELFAVRVGGFLSRFP